jgi:hypothetical protein
MQWPPPHAWEPRHDLPAPISAGTRAAGIAKGAKKPAKKRSWLIPVVLLSLIAVVAVVLLTRGDDTKTATDVTVDGSVVAVATTEAPSATLSPGTAPPETPSPTVELIIETTVPTETTTPTETTVAEPSTPTSSTSPTTVPAQPSQTGKLADDLTLIVAADDGTHLVNAASDTVILPGSAAVSFRASDRSLIAQTKSGRFDGSSEETNIRRKVAGGDAVIVAANDGDYLRLHDVSSGDGNDILVLYSIQQGSTAEDSVEGLYILNLLDGRTTYVGVIGGWESGTNQLDLANNAIVGEASSGASTGLYSVDRRGNAVDLNTKLGLDPIYADCSECPHHFSIDQAGRFVAYGENGSLVIADLSGADEVRRFPIPGFVEGFGTDLDIRDGSVVIINRDAAASLVVDTRSGTAVVTELPIIGRASFG